jgi:hypothetical protein
MATLLLTRRRTQLALLAQACRERRRARILEPGTAQRGIAPTETRFAALEADAVLMQWPRRVSGRIAHSGATVDVYFHDGDHLLGFRTQTRGRASCVLGSGTHVAAWKLGVPLCVEPREQRHRRRVQLPAQPPTIARCTRVSDGRHSFAARLENLSTGGLQVQAPLTEAAWVRPGEGLWIQFTPPGQSRACDFVVRVVHASPQTGTGTVVLGCRFCPSDDAVEHHRRLACVQLGLLHAEGTGRDAADVRQRGGV